MLYEQQLNGSVLSIAFYSLLFILYLQHWLYGTPQDSDLRIS